MIKILDVTIECYTNDVTRTPDDKKGKEVEGFWSKVDRVIVGNGTQGTQILVLKLENANKTATLPWVHASLFQKLKQNS